MRLLSEAPNTKCCRYLPMFEFQHSALFSSVCRSELSCSVSGFLFRLQVWNEDQNVYKCGPNIIYLSAVNSIASFPPRIAMHVTVVCAGRRCRGNKFCNVIRVFVMFSAIQSNLFQVMMLLNCIMVVPDLDLGREIKYSGTFLFLCPCRQMSGWQLQLLLDRFRAQPFLFIIPFNTVQHGLVKASLNKPHRLRELLEGRSTKPCSSRS